MIVAINIHPGDIRLIEREMVAVEQRLGRYVNLVTLAFQDGDTKVDFHAGSEVCSYRIDDGMGRLETIDV